MASSSTRTFCEKATASTVLFDKRGENYLVTLNRPKALNALTMEMIEQMTPFYKTLAMERKPRVVVVKGAGEKAFCAGGDVRALYDMCKEKRPLKEITEFFFAEYELDNLMAETRGAVHNVCLLNGITMGGGVGLSVHGRYRVATDNTMFAMPETGIGFYTDVGGAHFLPRLLPKGLGEFLAFTGHRLKGADNVHAGIATHFVPSERMAELEETLLACEFPEQTASILADFAVHPSRLAPFTLAAHMESMKHFTRETVEDVFDALDNDRNDPEFCNGTAAKMRSVSPTSLKIIHRALREGEKLTLRQVLDMELKIVSQCMVESDFVEGVRAQLVDKDRSPKWSPEKLEDVKDSDIDKYFQQPTY
jgi:3-hydroxyisobutyryl-CoA hydrolase